MHQYISKYLLTFYWIQICWVQKKNPTSHFTVRENTLAIQAILKHSDQKRDIQKTYWINQIDHAKGHDVKTNNDLADNIYHLTNGYLPS